MIADLSKKITEKLKRNFGETIAETLIALLIGVLAMMMLPIAVVSAARTNKKAEEISVYGEASQISEAGVTGVTVSFGGETDTIENAALYRIEMREGTKDIYYYEIERKD